MPKRDEQNFAENKFMVFYECGTTEIHIQENSQFNGWTHIKTPNKQSAPCKEIVRLRNTIECMKHKNDA